MNDVFESDLWESNLPTPCTAFLMKHKVIDIGVNLTIQIPHFLTFFLNIESSILPGISLIGLVICPLKLLYDKLYEKLLNYRLNELQVHYNFCSSSTTLKTDTLILSFSSQVYRNAITSRGILYIMPV